MPSFIQLSVWAHVLMCVYVWFMHACLLVHASKGACGDQRSMSDVFLLLSARSFVTGHLPQPHLAPLAGRHVLGSAYLCAP